MLKSPFTPFPHSFSNCERTSQRLKGVRQTIQHTRKPGETYPGIILLLYVVFHSPPENVHRVYHTAPSNVPPQTTAGVPFLRAFSVTKLHTPAVSSPSAGTRRTTSNNITTKYSPAIQNAFCDPRLKPDCENQP